MGRHNNTRNHGKTLQHDSQTQAELIAAVIIITLLGFIGGKIRKTNFRQKTTIMELESRIQISQDIISNLQKNIWGCEDMKYKIMIAAQYSSQHSSNNQDSQPTSKQNNQPNQLASQPSNQHPTNNQA